MKLKVKAETIIRTIVLVIALVNQVLTVLGKNPIPISEDEVYQLVTMIVSIAASVWAWWKNNSFTNAAIRGDMLMETIKKEEADQAKARRL